MTQLLLDLKFSFLLQLTLAQVGFPKQNVESFLLLVFVKGFVCLLFDFLVDSLCLFNHLKVLLMGLEKVLVGLLVRLVLLYGFLV